MEWFSSWFDSKYHRILYNHRNIDEATLFINKLFSHLSPAPGTKVLDLASGDGRHSISISKLGFDVTGLELTELNVNQAKKFENEKLRFIKSDMRIPFSNNKYDLIVNLFTSFGYFDDDSEDIKVLENVVDALLPNGIFVIDFLNAKKVKSNLVSKEQVIKEGVLFNISRSFEKGFIRKNIEVIDGANTLNFSEKVRGFIFEDFKTIFGKVGLEINEVFGSYSLSEFDEYESDRLIIIACKK